MAENLPEEERITRYIDGEMTAAEKAVFESELSQNETLKTTLDQFIFAREALKYYGLQEKVSATGKRYLASVEERNGQRTHVFNISKTVRFTLGVAASIIVALIVIRSVWFNNPSADKVYEEVYVEYRIAENRSGDNVHEAIEAAWMKNNYREVISLGERNLSGPQDRLLLGLAYLHTNEATKAIRTLEPLRQISDPIYQQHADFYLATAYLKNKEFNKALALFTKIRNDQRHLYHGQVSAEILEEVNKLQK